MRMPEEPWADHDGHGKSSRSGACSGGRVDLVTAIFGDDTGRKLLTTSIVWSMIIAGFAALVMEVLRIRNAQPLPALAAGDRPWRGGAAGLDA